MADRICSTPGCDRPAHYAARSLCQRCYYQVTLPDVERFEKRITAGDDGCWIWTGYSDRPGGRYGRMGLAGNKRIYAHRWSYEYHRAPIPEGLEIDHLCRVTLCVNPWHLEPVTPDENRRRRLAAETHCRNGHEYTEANTYRAPSDLTRRCRTCQRQHEQRRRRKRPSPA